MLFSTKAEYGVRLMVELASADRPSEFRVGLRNFYVITRYNRSQNYAMAVYELSREIRAAYGGQ